VEAKGGNGEWIEAIEQLENTRTSGNGSNRFVMRKLKHRKRGIGKEERIYQSVVD